MLKINQIDLKKEYADPAEELKATKSYIYQLVEELRYRLGDEPEEEPEEDDSKEELIGEAIRGSYKYLDAEGISADWLQTGVIHDTLGNFYLNLDTGVLRASSLALQLTDQLGENLHDYIDAIAQNLQDQIDGVIEQFFDEYDPTRNNEPAATWIQDGKEADHNGDSFTNILSGHSWRWIEKNNLWQWVAISDSDIQRALVMAAQAQATADGKRRVFVTTPEGPYDEGDLWTDGDDLYVCNQGRTTGYLASEWELAYEESIGSLYSSITSHDGQLTSVMTYLDPETGNLINSVLNQTPTRFKIRAANLDLEGYATFSALGQAGQTVINGANVSTGTISGACLKLGNNTDSYGWMKIYNSGNTLCGEFNRQGIHLYRKGTKVGRIGTLSELTDVAEGTFLGINYGTNTKGILFQEGLSYTDDPESGETMILSARAYAFYRNVDDGFQIYDNNATSRVRLSTAGLRVKSANGTNVISLTSSGLSIKEAENGLTLVNLNTSGFAVYDTLGQTKMRVLEGNWGLFNNDVMRVQLVPTGVRLMDTSGTKRAELTISGLYFYASNGTTITKAYPAT